MLAFIAITSAILAIASADHPAPYHAPHPAPHYDEAPKPYSYGYAVTDDYSGANFNAHEAADGKAVSGSYQVSTSG